MFYRAKVDTAHENEINYFELFCLVQFCLVSLGPTAKQLMKNSETYKVVIELPREAQEALHNIKAKRHLSGKKQSVSAIASELLGAAVKQVAGAD